MMIRTFALFTLIALTGCASSPPMVVVFHTVPNTIGFRCVIER